MNLTTGMRALYCALVVTVFAGIPWAQTASKYSVLYNFTNGKDGGFPSGPPTLDNWGNLYGGTYNGGQGCSNGGCGVVFELVLRANGQWSENILHEFAGHSDGSTPIGSLIRDVSGNVYGAMTGDAGAAESGVFELTSGTHGWSNTVIYSPGGCCLTLDTSGLLYGGVGSGTYDQGAISELLHGSDGWTLDTLYSFCAPSNCPNGVEPRAQLTWDVAGNLYGTTFFGGNVPPKCPGNLGCGVAFQMTPNGDGTWTYHLLHLFAAFPYDGRYPYAGLVVDAAGNAYGTTSQGGPHGGGTIYKLTPTPKGYWKQTVLYDFPNCANGCGPNTSLVFDQAGNLYGTAGGGLTVCDGGGYYCGVVFKLTPQSGGTWKYSLLHKFNGTDGNSGNGVVIDGKGNLFGTTFIGGTYNAGVAFEITP
jgi:uncharacterized repeat protein (TIGR03803 family)